jgi:hypothetical protein
LFHSFSVVTHKVGQSASLLGTSDAVLVQRCPFVKVFGHLGNGFVVIASLVLIYPKPFLALDDGDDITTANK